MDIQDSLANSKIIDVDIEREMKQSFLDYSMSVIVSRALPDVRDGLKPVHRRILYSMDENGLTHEKPTRKCATIVGAVILHVVALFWIVQLLVTVSVVTAVPLAFV